MYVRHLQHEPRGHLIELDCFLRYIDTYIILLLLLLKAVFIILCTVENSASVT